MVQKADSSSINLSLSGCGFLGVYHIGVICAVKEHAPEILENKMAGCSAGSLVAACAMSGCCLGQMCSDALEIAIRARSRALGPLHPTFSIVEIIRNGLRRILPPNAHELCSGRLYISLTRWKDNKNIVINEFQTREELIQVLICSSFVPYWSGVFPHKFRGEYYWDGGLTNNNPVIDENTILVSPFAGESDICPRDESGSFFSVDFRGTDISFTQENLYRLTRALFPPNLSVLKQICWRGYIDGLKFLQTRNLIKSSRLGSRTTISSVLGSDYTEPVTEDENELRQGGIGHDLEQSYADIDDQDNQSMEDDENSSELSQDEREDDENDNDDGAEDHYDSLENSISFSPYCEKVTRKKELPTPLFAVFAHARQKIEDPVVRYFTESNLYRVWSLMALPVTLPIDLTYAITKRMFSLIRPSMPNFLGSLFTENDESYCYHVNDCECTESRISSSHRIRTRRRRSGPGQRSRVRFAAPLSTYASTSYRSDCPSDDEDVSTINQDDNGFLSSVSNIINNLPPPDLVQSTMNEEYRHHLQQMADLSNQQLLKEQSMSYFPEENDQNSNEVLPTSSLEKTLLFQ